MKKINKIFTSILGAGIITSSVIPLTVSCGDPVQPEVKEETADSEGMVTYYFDLKDEPDGGQIEASIVGQTNSVLELGIKDVEYISETHKAKVDILIENFEDITEETKELFSILLNYKVKGESSDTKIDGITIKCLKFDDWHDPTEVEQQTAFIPTKPLNTGTEVIDEYFNQAKELQSLDFFADDLLYGIKDTLSNLSSTGKIDLSGKNDKYMVNIHKINFTDDKKANFTIEFDVVATALTTIAPWTGDEYHARDVKLNVTYVIDDGILTYQSGQIDDDDFTRFDMTAARPFHGHITGTCELEDKANPGTWWPRTYNQDWSFKNGQMQEEATIVAGNIAQGAIYDPANPNAQGTLKSSFFRNVKVDSIGSIKFTDGRQLDAGTFANNHICDPESPIILEEQSFPRDQFQCSVIAIKKFENGIVPDNFFADCPNLTVMEDFTQQGVNITSIGDNYHRNCYKAKSFGQLPITLECIGSHFLENFGTKATSPQTEIDIQNNKDTLQSIGSCFLHNTVINTLTLGTWTASDLERVFGTEGGAESFASDTDSNYTIGVHCSEEAFKKLKTIFKESNTAPYRHWKFLG